MVALAAMLLAGGQGVSPAAGSAPHWDGKPGTYGFLNPALSVTPSTATTDSISDLYIRVKQADREEVVRSHRVTLPGWRFAVGNMPQSSLLNCGAADSTTDTFDLNHIGKKMEAVGRFGVVLHTDRTRDPNDYPGDSPTGSAKYGSFHSGANHRYLWFLGWTPGVKPGTGTAKLCGLINTGNGRIPNDTTTNDRIILVEVLLTLLSDSSWEISWDFMPADGDKGKPDTQRRSVLDKASFQNGNVSILDTELTLFRWSMGNVSKHPTGQPKPLIFTQTSTEPGNYQAIGTFTPCSDETDTPPLPCDSDVPPAVRTQTIKITPPPSPFVRDFGRLTKPSGPTGMPTGFALIQGETSVQFAWEQPVTHPDFPIKGYVLAVAVPHVQSTLHYEYLVTNKDYVATEDKPGFDPREPCGEDGLSPECSLTLTFPLDTVGGTKLPPSGKYAVALITVYADGGRTDGRCDSDDPAERGPGIECPASMPPINVVKYSPKDFWLNGERHGISGLEFMMLPKKWPNVFVHSVSLTPTGLTAPGPVQGTPNTFSVGVPFALLLADFDSTPKDAAFVLWKAHQPTFETFPGTGQVGIQGQGQNGVVSFGLHIGTNKHYRFDGVVQGAAAPHARGLFVQYDSQQVARGPAPPNNPDVTAAVGNPFGYPSLYSQYLVRYLEPYQNRPCKTLKVDLCLLFEGTRL